MTHRLLAIRVLGIAAALHSDQGFRFVVFKSIRKTCLNPSFNFLAEVF